MTRAFVPADQFFERHKRDRFKVRCKHCQEPTSQDNLRENVCGLCAIEYLADGLATLFEDLPEGEYIVTAKNENLEGSQEVNLVSTQEITIVITEGGVSPSDIDWMLVGGVAVALLIIIGGIYYYYRERKRK